MLLRCYMLTCTSGTLLYRYRVVLCCHMAVVAILLCPAGTVYREDCPGNVTNVVKYEFKIDQD